MTRTC